MTSHAFESWRQRPGGVERRIRRFASLLLRLVIYAALVATFSSAVLAAALLMFGVTPFRSAALSVALLVVSLGAGLALGAPAWRMLITEHRFRCFFCEGETARARRQDLRLNDERWMAIRYSFDCERCGRSDSEL